MGYVVGADELIPTLTPSSKTYDIAILPQGPHFYTWLLQAAGYLLLDSKKKKMIIISSQNDESKEILVDNNRYGPVLGQYRKHSLSKISAFASQIGAKISVSEQESLSKHLRLQLPFLRVITETEELLHISIGSNISQAKQKKLISRIQNHMNAYSIVLLTNITLTQTGKKANEQKQIADSIEKSKDPLVDIFHQTVDLTKKKREIIAYVNPGDFGVKEASEMRYVCVVG